MTLENKRFIIKYDRFGAYFFDTDADSDMDLEEVLWILNDWYESYIRMGIKND